MTAFTGIILAGGKSTRLGTEKSFLEVGEKPLIVRVMDVFSGLFDEILISANDPEPYSELPARVVLDEVPEGGALIGLHSSLSAMNTEYAFVAACDMPFLSRELIRYMIDRAEGYDALVPRIDDYLEPLHAVYSKNCVDAIRRQSDAGHKHLRSFYDDIKIEYVDKETVERLDPAGLTFFNINTHEDLDKARSLLSSSAVTR